MKRLQSISTDLEKLRIRFDILVIGARRAQEELKDNPKRHLVRCKCGRMDTRYDCCVTCTQERLRKEML